MRTPVAALCSQWTMRSLHPWKDRQLWVLKWLGLNKKQKPSQIRITLEEFKWALLSRPKLCWDQNRSLDYSHDTMPSLFDLWTRSLTWSCEQGPVDCFKEEGLAKAEALPTLGAIYEHPSVKISTESLLWKYISLFSFNKLFNVHLLSIYYVLQRKQSGSILNSRLKMIF